MIVKSFKKQAFGRGLVLFLLFAVTVVSFFGPAPLKVSAASIIDAGDYVYQVVDEESVKIIQYRGESLYVSLPSTVENYRVTAVASSAFMSNHSIKELDISGTVSVIESNAFAECTALQKLQIPGSVQSIEDCAFMNCSALRSVTLLDGVVSIGSAAFSGCTSLSEVRLPNSLDFIDDYAFFNCSSLNEILIPSTLKELGGYVLEGTGWMKSQKKDFVTVGDGILIKYTGTEKSRSVPDEVKTIGEYAFAENYSLDTILLPRTVTKVAAHAFKNCTGLKKVTLPDSIREIGEYAFFGCTSLDHVILPKGITQISDGVLMDCSSLTEIQIPPSVVEIGTSAFENCTKLKSLKMQNGTQTVGLNSFRNCTSLGRLVLPETVNFVSAQSFEGCINLTRVECGGDPQIVVMAFSDCINLQEVVFYKNPTDLDDMAFYGITDITLYSDNSLYVQQYAEKKRFHSDTIRNLPPYVDQGIISTSIPEAESQFSGEYTFILIMIIVVDVAAILLFSLYLLFFQPKGRHRRKAKAPSAGGKPRHAEGQKRPPQSPQGARPPVKKSAPPKPTESGKTVRKPTSSDREKATAPPKPSVPRTDYRRARYVTPPEKTSSAEDHKK